MEERKLGIVTSGLGHVYYICPDCGHWSQAPGAHQHKDGSWIDHMWLKEFYGQDKQSCMKRWASIQPSTRP